MSLWISERPGSGRYLNTSFNPCFAGCPSGSVSGIYEYQLNGTVSILVLLDVPLDPGGCLHDGIDPAYVSILVLLDVPLDPVSACIRYADTRGGFNPCFAGCPSGSTPDFHLAVDVGLCFNPCFAGCPSGSVVDQPVIRRRCLVSILVLLDVPLDRSA